MDERSGLGERLRREVPTVRTSDAEVDRLAYARDLWPRHHLEVRSGHLLEASRPALVAWPTSTEDVARLVRIAASEGTPVVPFGAGSGVCAGILPDKRTLVLDLKKMSTWRTFDRETPSLDVEAGALGITLEEQLQRRDFTIGHFPSSILCSTVGGWLAARGAGQCSGRYGKIEDMVASIEMVDGRGDVVTLNRRVHGPDLIPLLIGSEGTLGVITSAKLRLHPNPTTRAFTSFSFPTLEEGWTAMRDMFQAGLRPAVSRLYDPFDSMIAKRGSTKTKERKKSSGPGAGLKALKSILRAPRVLNGLIDAVGDRAFGGSMLVLIFEGVTDEVHDDARRAGEIAAKLRGAAMGEGPARKWMSHRYAVSYRQSPVFMSGSFSDTMEVSAPWSRLGAMYEAVRRALGRHVFVMAHLSHAYPDGCSIYFTFAGSAENDEACARRYDEAWRAALAAVVEAGGSLSHHHGVGRSKAPRLASELGAGVDLVRAMMRAFDPKGILNPGSLLPLSGDRTGVPPVGKTTFEVDEASLLATLPGSMTLREAKDALSRRGLELPMEATDDTIATWLAKGAHGQPNPWLDPVDHLLAGLRAELPSGELLDVRPSPRRAVGPDLLALYVGSDRCGRVVAADVRVHRKGAIPARALPYAGPLDTPMSSGESALWERIATELTGS